MTQPDLVSKLREVIASKRKWAEHVAKVCMAESNQFRAGDVIAFCDELESLLGLEGQAAEPATVEVCGVCGDFLAGDYCATCDEYRTHAPFTPKEKFVSRDEFNDRIADEAAQSCVDWSNLERRKEALRYIVKQIWNEAITEREASTPIVPGTAGLSAEQVRSVLAKHWLSGIHCHHAISPDDFTYDWASCACSEVNLPHRGTVGEAAGTWIEHVLSLLAERPAPAGEVSKGERQ